MAFANAMALGIYRFEQKTTTWVAHHALPLYVYIYALKSPMRQALQPTKTKDGTTVPNILLSIYERLPIPRYANYLNAQCVVAIARLVPLTETQRTQHNNPDSPLLLLSSPKSQTLFLDEIYPLPNPFFLLPAPNKNGIGLSRPQRWLTPTPSDSRKLWLHCLNEFTPFLPPSPLTHHTSLLSIQAPQDMFQPSSSALSAQQASPATPTGTRAATKPGHTKTTQPPKNSARGTQPSNTEATQPAKDAGGTSATPSTGSTRNTHPPIEADSSPTSRLLVLSPAHNASSNLPRRSRSPPRSNSQKRERDPSPPNDANATKATRRLPPLLQQADSAILAMAASFSNTHIVLPDSASAVLGQQAQPLTPPTPPPQTPLPSALATPPPQLAAEHPPARDSPSLLNPPLQASAPSLAVDPPLAGHAPLAADMDAPPPSPSHPPAGDSPSMLNPPVMASASPSAVDSPLADHAPMDADAEAPPPSPPRSPSPSSLPQPSTPSPFEEAEAPVNQARPSLHQSLAILLAAQSQVPQLPTPPTSNKLLTLIYHSPDSNITTPRQASAMLMTTTQAANKALKAISIIRVDKTNNRSVFELAFQDSPEGAALRLAVILKNLRPDGTPILSPNFTDISRDTFERFTDHQWNGQLQLISASVRTITANLKADKHGNFPALSVQAEIHRILRSELQIHNVVVFTQRSSNRNSAPTYNIMFLNVDPEPTGPAWRSASPPPPCAGCG